MENDIRESLQGAGCALPAGFAVDVETAEEGPKGFEIAYAIHEAPARAGACTRVPAGAEPEPAARRSPGAAGGSARKGRAG